MIEDRDSNDRGMFLKGLIEDRGSNDRVHNDRGGKNNTPVGQFHPDSEIYSECFNCLTPETANGDVMTPLVTNLFIHNSTWCKVCSVLACIHR